MSSAFLAELVTFAHAYPHPDTEPAESWDQKCALLMARLGLAAHGVGWAVPPRYYGDAYPIAVATGKVTPLKKDASAAPIGAFHFWIISGTVGHVGVDANGGGTTVFMATAHLGQAVEECIGINSVAGYSAYANSQGGHYVGWADNYNGGKYKLPSEAPKLSTTQRQAGPLGVNAHSEPDTTASLVKTQCIGPNGIVDFGIAGRGYVTGQSVTVGNVTSSIWYYSGNAYLAAAAFLTVPGTAGLTNLTPSPVIAPVAPPAAEPPTDPVAEAPTPPASTAIPVDTPKPASTPTTPSDDVPISKAPAKSKVAPVGLTVLGAAIAAFIAWLIGTFH